MAVETVFAEERKMKIVEYIKNHRKATVGELCDVFQVSSATIRNDLRELESISPIIRTHGGAMVKTQAGFEPSSREKRISGQAGKEKIGAAALKFIETGDTIILDTGTTTMELARLLSAKPDITVVTNDVRIAALLEDTEGITVYLVGGKVRKGFHCTVGAAGRQMLSGITADKAFIGANGLSFEKGATTPHIGHAETKQAMIQASKKIFLLCDNSKLGRNAFAKFAPLDVIDTLITDSISEEDKKRFEDEGIDVINT